MTGERLRHIQSKEWFGAEGKLDGKLILIRGRRFLSEQIPNPLMPRLFVTTFRYEVSDPIGLPTEIQYGDIARFETTVIDALDESRIGRLALIETSNGEARYYVYVSDVDVAADFVNARAEKCWDIDIATKEDAEWHEYRKRIGKIESNAACIERVVRLSKEQQRDGAPWHRARFRF